MLLVLLGPCETQIYQEMGMRSAECGLRLGNSGCVRPDWERS